MARASAGDWVEISLEILQAHERAPNLPPDTSAVPYTLRVRGFAITENEEGQEISIVTVAGREYRGRLEEIGPAFRPEYGNSVPELLQARLSLKELTRELK